MLQEANKNIKKKNLIELDGLDVTRSLDFSATF